MSNARFNIFNLASQKIRMLHICWFAFFLSFFVWFSHAPLMVFIKEAFDLSSQEIKALLVLNVALTIPARIIIGMLVDSYGPRKIFSAVLLTSSLLSVAFALSQTYEQLALFRFLLGFSGAGFVIGIRLVSEWFPARQVGVAEGIYGGWGNFGSAAAAALLPIIAYQFGGDDGWRYALISVSVVIAAYGVLFFFIARDTPAGSTYFKPQKTGGLEVSSWNDLYFYVGMNVPMYIALYVLTWKLSPINVGLLSEAGTLATYTILALLFAFQTWSILKVNVKSLKQGVPEHQQYSFKQVAILNMSYLVTFGAEIAVVSMLPLYYMEVFELSAVNAGMLAATFAGMNLIARPAGGWFSDHLGRRFALLALVAGLTVGFLLMSQIDASWSLWLAVPVTMLTSCFVNGGAGAVFAVVPLIKRRITGQIAGMTGAYGNVGGVIFLTTLSFVEDAQFFQVIAAFGVLTFICVYFLDEPQGHMTEVAEDGSIQLIEVS